MQPISTASSPTEARKLVLDVITDQPKTLGHIALDAYGEDTPKRRGLARQAIYWMISVGLVVRVRRGEFKTAGAAPAVTVPEEMRGLVTAALDALNSRQDEAPETWAERLAEAAVE